MLQVKVNTKQAEASIRKLADGTPKAIASAMRSEGRRLQVAVAGYAKSRSWGPYSRFTILTRKKYKGGYGTWLSRFMRYFVNPESLTLKVGLLSLDDIDKAYARFEPISRGYSSSAKKHARGFDATFTREAQRAWAQWLQQRFGKQTDEWHKWIPKVGKHRVKPRPAVERVFQMERSRIGRNIERLMMTKLQGGRWSRDWAEEWGNKD